MDYAILMLLKLIFGGVLFFYFVVMQVRFLSWKNFFNCRLAILDYQTRPFKKEWGRSRPVNYLILVFLAVGIFSCSDKNRGLEGREEKIDSFTVVQEHFQDPPAEYRSAPLWVWNDRVTEQKIDRQLQQFKKKGIGGVFVHPRPGLITPYLSGEWHELFEYTVERGKDMNMKIWIYDENSYPSGFAGGHVPAKMPESFNRGQGLTLHQSETLPDSVEKFHLVLREATEGFLEISNEDDMDRKTERKNRNYYLFEKTYYSNTPWYGGYSYVDLLLSGVTEEFINITMKGYEQNFGDEFGEVVPGIFTDEPNISPPPAEKTIRWTPGLFDKFQDRWGYSLKKKLPALYEEIDDWQKVRHDYYSLLLDLFIDNWSKPWNEYTNENNLQWTGHYWEHGWPNPGHGGDNMAMYAWHQVPGIDILFNNYEKGVNAQFGNVRAVKEVSSIANQMGRDRTLSETYGGGGWNLRFQDMKRIGDWEYVLGVNFLNQHLSHMTIKGARKRDYPQSFSYHEPWWDYYQVLGDYYGRLSLALSAGEQVNNILVIEPTTSAWMYYSVSGDNEELQQLGEEFQEFLVNIEAAQTEYDLGSERIIREFGSVNKEHFVVGERAYNLVVMPPGLKNLDQNTVELMEDYLDRGGEILSFVPPPEYVDGRKSSKLKSLQAEAGDQWQNGNTSDLSGYDLLTADDFEISRSDTSYGNLFHRRMELEDGQMLFLVNTSEEEKAAGNVEMVGQSVKKLNLFSGEVENYPSEKISGKSTFAFDIPPVGSLLLYIDNDPVKQEEIQQKNTHAEIIVSEKPLKIDRKEPNTLTLDYCDVAVEDQEELANTYCIDAANKVFSSYGFSGNPWSRAVQYKSEILKKDNFGKETGFEATYTFRVNGLEKGKKDSLQAVIERPRRWEVFLNGNQIEPIPEQWWLDRSFGKYNIGEYVHEGENQLTIRISPMSVFSELEPVYILGDFGLESTSTGWEIVPSTALTLGEWRNQKMPFYSDGVIYTKNYQIDLAEDSEYFIQLNEWQGTVASVKVNEKKAGIIGWPPYKLDISEYIRDGENEVEVTVFGSLKNLLGPHHDNPEKWIASPWMFEDAPRHPPPGKEYDVIGYGLMEDFKLVKEM